MLKNMIAKQNLRKNLRLMNLMTIWKTVMDREEVLERKLLRRVSLT